MTEHLAVTDDLLGRTRDGRRDTTGADNDPPANAATGRVALRVQGVALDLGGRRVLQDVELTLRIGEFVGLIGPNGAGKTTLLRAALGLLRTAEGQITIDGKHPRRGRDAIGYVPQRHEFAWDFPISVEDVVMTGRTSRIGWIRRPGTSDYQAVGRALARVGMTGLRHRPVGQLSGGQRQRVLVARALAREPRVLLLDEPFTGLDMPTQELLHTLFRDLSREGQAVLMTTHDLLGALHGCDRLALINRTIVAEGRPDELTDPQVWMRTFRVGPASPLLSLIAGLEAAPPSRADAPGPTEHQEPA